MSHSQSIPCTSCGEHRQGHRGKGRRSTGQAETRADEGGSRREARAAPQAGNGVREPDQRQPLGGALLPEARGRRMDDAERVRTLARGVRNEARGNDSGDEAGAC